MSDHLTRLDAEQSVLGALLLDNRAVAKVSDWLRPEDFAHGMHRTIYNGCLILAAHGKPFDAVTLAELMEPEHGPEGTRYVLELVSTTPSAANVVAYAEIVLEASKLRQLADLGARLSAAASEKGRASADVIAQTLPLLAELQGDATRTGLQPVKAAAGEFFRDLLQRYESGEKFSGRLTPWKGVNDLTLGLKPADCIVIAGRPGMGKSVAGFGLATFDALREGRPAVFSLEMSAPQFVEREVAALGEVPHEWLRAPDKDAKDVYGENVADAYWTRTSRAMHQLIASKLLIDDTPALTIDQIAARARRAHLQAPLTMVVIDHLHIVKVKGGEGLVHQLGDVSRGAKKLAKELRCPVILLAQLNRGNEQRTDKRPTMADLRGSGEIEQDADYILLLHREDYYDENSYAKGLVEMIVGKARHARRQVVALQNRLDQMRFDDWEGALPVAPEVKQPRRAGGFE